MIQMIRQTEYLQAKKLVDSYEKQMKSTWFEAKDLTPGMRVSVAGRPYALWYVVELQGNDVLLSTELDINDDDYDDYLFSISELRPDWDGKWEFTTLLNLASNFDKLMFHSEFVPSEPKAEFWKAKGSDTEYWEIGDVRQDGTYLCYGSSDKFIDQDTPVAIKYK